MKQIYYFLGVMCFVMIAWFWLSVKANTEELKSKQNCVLKQ